MAGLAPGMPTFFCEDCTSRPHLVLDKNANRVTDRGRSMAAKPDDSDVSKRWVIVADVEVDQDSMPALESAFSEADIPVVLDVFPGSCYVTVPVAHAEAAARLILLLRYEQGLSEKWLPMTDLATRFVIVAALSGGEESIRALQSAFSQADIPMGLDGFTGSYGVDVPLAYAEAAARLILSLRREQGWSDKLRLVRPRGRPPDGCGSRRTLLLTVNACIVLALSAAAVGSSLDVIFLLRPARPFALMGAIAFLPVLLVFGVAVFCSAFRRNRTAAVVATGMFLLGSALGAFGVVANIVEAFRDVRGVNLRFVFTFGSIGLVVVAYGLFCGILWLRWARCLTGETAPDGTYGRPSC